MLKGKFKVPQKIKEVGLKNCYVSEISIIELRIGDTYSILKGIIRPSDSERIRNTFKIIPISQSSDFIADEIARLQSIGRPVHKPFDLMIGCTAVVNNMIMVTENEKDFENITGIEIENWVNRE